MASGAFVSVYRSDRAETIGALVRMAERAGLRVALWALDAEIPALADRTVGVGPGHRLELLNRLVATLGSTVPDPLVISDDDIRFHRGDLAMLLRLVRRARFGLAQPAHASGSNIGIAFTRRQRKVIARKTTFVEAGPLCVFRAPWSSSLLPFPETLGMGWGVDILWSDHAGDVPMGIVDAVTIEHVGEIGAEYDIDVEREQMQRLLEERGVASVDQIARTLGTWKRWRPFPPWARPRS